MVRFIPRDVVISVHRIGIDVGPSAIMEELILKISEKFPEVLPLETTGNSYHFTDKDILPFKTMQNFLEHSAYKFSKNMVKEKNPFREMLVHLRNLKFCC
jgi:hypothetical protein